MPKGLTVEGFQANGSIEHRGILISYADRANGHALTKAKTKDGKIRLVGYSISNKAFTGNDGVLFNMTVKVSTIIGGHDIKIF